MKLKEKKSNKRKIILYFCLFIFISLSSIQLLTKNISATIIDTNDIHGIAFPTKIMRLDSREEYNYGGLIYLAD